MIGDPVDKQLLVVNKNTRCIWKKFLDENWVAAHEENEYDDMKLCVYDSEEDAGDPA